SPVSCNHFDLECKGNQTHADCSGLGLAEIPSHLSPDLCLLDLSNNSLTTIPAHAFQMYPKLKFLFIRFNKIVKLSNFSFATLPALDTLDLHGNWLEMTSSAFPADAFSSLVSLQLLRINRNNPILNKTGHVYPDDALSKLVSLTHLYMDGIEVTEATPFGSGFLSLKKLGYLSLSGSNNGYCYMKRLYNNTFENLGHLYDLDLQGCGLQGDLIEAGAFSPLTNLTTLSLISNDNINIDGLPAIFYGLRNALNLRRFLLNQIVHRYSLSICLDGSYLQHFPKHLNYFEARENRLEGIDRHVVDQLSPSLETLDISGNKFVFGTYLKDIHKMKSLKRVMINSATIDFPIPIVYPSTGHDVKNSTCNLYEYRETDVQDDTFIIRLPPKLERIQMNDAGLNYLFTKMHFDPDNSLQVLSLRENHFPSLWGPIYGLNKLTFLDLSFCFIAHISPEFFQNMTSLEVLLLQGNPLGDFFADPSSAGVFSHLTNLNTLNMSFSNIYLLPEALLSQMKNLQKLSLDRNRLESFTLSISAATTLELLNLSDTHISTLPLQTRQHIDWLISRNVTTKIYMADAPISCDCQNYDFMNWMAQSPAFARNFKGYTCVFPDFSTINLATDINETVTYLNRKCSSHSVLFFVVGSCTAVVFGLIICVIVYRFRWNLKYLYYGAYVLFQGKKRDARQHEFTYDAFICYAEEDFRFVRDTLRVELAGRGLKIFIHTEDFTSGEFISSNIVRAVNVSRKTVVVLTKELLESHWCSFEVEMARMESVYTGRQVLVFVLMEEIPKSRLGRELLYCIKNNTYMEYPGERASTAQMQVWWDKLAKDIKI
ncbi:unnamed protein product, partial [Lymnaea stagnalis]